MGNHLQHAEIAAVCDGLMQSDEQLLTTRTIIEPLRCLKSADGQVRARKSHDCGLAVLMGVPNIVRGKSHNGNASARDFAKAGFLDIISSDYVPASLLHACLTLENSVEGISMPQAISMVTKTPAHHVGLNDRGETSPGKLADLVIFSKRNDVPVISQVWRQGVRVA